MAKKGVYQFQANLTTDEEFEEFLTNPGLLLLEIYTEWCGPCLGMVIMLKSIQAEVGVENLRLAICKSDTISYLKRFKRKSEPHWLFVLNGRATDIVIGTNVPYLFKIIRKEVAASLGIRPRSTVEPVFSHMPKKKVKEHELTFERITYDVTEPQPVEVKRINQKEAAATAIMWQKALAKEKERRDFFNNVTNLIRDNLPYMGVTVFGPHIQLAILKKLTEVADAMHISCKDRKVITVTQEDWDVVNYLCKNPLGGDVLDYFIGKQILLIYWRVPDDRLGQVPQVLQEFAQECMTQHTEPPADAKEKKRIIPPLLEPLKVQIEVKEGEPYSESEEDVQEIEEIVKPTKSSKSVHTLKPSRSTRSMLSRISERENEDEEHMDNKKSTLRSTNSLTHMSRKSNKSIVFDEDDDHDKEIEVEVSNVKLAASDPSLATALSALTLEFGFDLEGLIDDEKVVEEPKIRMKTIIIPPIWVANTHRTHTTLIYKYFRNETKSFLPPDPPPIPPHIIMAFPAYKMKALMTEADRFKDEVLAYGFFNSDEPKETKLIANSVEKYLTKSKTDNDVMVFKIAKKTSHTMLSFVTYTPTYVSPTTEIGEKDAKKFFPENYLTAEQEAKLNAEAELAYKPHKEKDKLHKKKSERKMQSEPSVLAIQSRVSSRKSSASLISQKSFAINPNVPDVVSIVDATPPAEMDVEEFNTTTVKFSTIVREHEIPPATTENENNLSTDGDTEERTKDSAPSIDADENEPHGAVVKKQRSNVKMEQASYRAEGGAEITNVFTEIATYLPVIAEEEEEEELEHEFENAGRDNENIYIKVETTITEDFSSSVNEEDLECGMIQAVEEEIFFTPLNSVASNDENSSVTTATIEKISVEEDPVETSNPAILNRILFKASLEGKELRLNEDVALSKPFKNLPANEASHQIETPLASDANEALGYCSYNSAENQTEMEFVEQFKSAATASIGKAAIQTNVQFCPENTLSADFAQTQLVEMEVLISDLETAVSECLTLSKDFNAVDDLNVNIQTPVNYSVNVKDPIHMEEILFTEPFGPATVENAFSKECTQPAEISVATEYIDLFADLDHSQHLTTAVLSKTVTNHDEIQMDENLVFTKYTDLFEDLSPSTKSIPSEVTTTMGTFNAADGTNAVKDEVLIQQPLVKAECLASTNNSVELKETFPKERTAVAVGLALTEILGMLKGLTASKSEETPPSLADDVFLVNTTAATNGLMSLEKPVAVEDIAHAENCRFDNKELQKTSTFLEDNTTCKSSTYELVEENTKDFAKDIPVVLASPESIAALESANIADGIAFAASFVASFDHTHQSTSTSIPKIESQHRKITKRRCTSTEKQLLLRKSQALTEGSCNLKANRDRLNEIIGTTQEISAEITALTAVPITLKKSATIRRPKKDPMVTTNEPKVLLKSKAVPVKTKTGVKASSANKDAAMEQTNLPKSKTKKKVHTKLKKGKCKSLKKKISVVKTVIATDSLILNRAQAKVLKQLVESIPSPAKAKISKRSSALSTLDPSTSTAVMKSPAVSSFKDIPETVKNLVNNKTKKKKCKTHKKRGRRLSRL